jgi:hypothetical protein
MNQGFGDNGCPQQVMGMRLDGKRFIFVQLSAKSQLRVIPKSLKVIISRI